MNRHHTMNVLLPYHGKRTNASMYCYSGSGKACQHIDVLSYVSRMKRANGTQYISQGWSARVKRGHVTPGAGQSPKRRAVSTPQSYHPRRLSAAMPCIGAVPLCIADVCPICGVPLARKILNRWLQGFERSLLSRSAPLAKLRHALGVLQICSGLWITAYRFACIDSATNDPFRVPVLIVLLPYIIIAEYRKRANGTPHFSQG